jgi:hypothetical protein
MHSLKNLCLLACVKYQIDVSEYNVSFSDLVRNVDYQFCDVCKSLKECYFWKEQQVVLACMDCSKDYTSNTVRMISDTYIPNLKTIPIRNLIFALPKPIFFGVAKNDIIEMMLRPDAVNLVECFLIYLSDFYSFIYSAYMKECLYEFAAAFGNSNIFNAVDKWTFPKRKFLISVRKKTLKCWQTYPARKNKHILRCIDDSIIGIHIPELWDDEYDAKIDKILYREIFETKGLNESRIVGKIK